MQCVFLRMLTEYRHVGTAVLTGRDWKRSGMKAEGVPTEIIAITAVLTRMKRLGLFVKGEKMAAGHKKSL